ncbi:MAG: transcription antitermination factor NusB, partial [Candidatus Omnitrophota bacterium]
EVKNFTFELVKGVAENLEKIDSAIASYAANWQLKRMAFVDRNILRMGCFELMFREDIPPKVAINEAVELAKKYSDREAAKFVNGILDKVQTEKKQ